VWHIGVRITAVRGLRHSRATLSDSRCVLQRWTSGQRIAILRGRGLVKWRVAVLQHGGVSRWQVTWADVWTMKCCQMIRAFQDSAEHVWILAQTQPMQQQGAKGLKLLSFVSCFLEVVQKFGNLQVTPNCRVIISHCVTIFHPIIGRLFQPWFRRCPDFRHTQALMLLFLICAWCSELGSSKAGRLRPAGKSLPWRPDFPPWTWLWDVMIWLWEVMGMHISMQLYTPCSD
jgi:hypothetical protein